MEPNLQLYYMIDVYTVPDPLLTVTAYFGKLKWIYQSKAFPIASKQANNR